MREVLFGDLLDVIAAVVLESADIRVRLRADAGNPVCRRPERNFCFVSEPFGFDTQVRWFSDQPVALPASFQLAYANDCTGVPTLLTDLLVPSFTQMLRAMSAWLDKASANADARGDAADALLSLRLAPDMYPLAAQVRFPCFQAQEAVHRLRGEPLPEALEEVRREGWNAGERPGSLADAQARIAEALSFLGSVGPQFIDEDANRSIALELPNGMVFDMIGAQYARDWALPQFYFHVSMAYALLRNHGVELGKADLVPHMFTYLRPSASWQG